ncbi:13791_t:CDS:2, partial [Entrophospora sp. SA101]
MLDIKFKNYICTAEIVDKSLNATKSSENNNDKYNDSTYYNRIRKYNIRDEPITLNNWYLHINWLHTPFLIATPLISLYGLYTTPIQFNTAIWTICYYFITGLGITAGHHRLWAHRAYKASRALEILLVLASSGAVQGSVRWWCRDHRAHHRYTDTDKDPYNANKGLFYSHIGWMMLKPNPNNIGNADISDLSADPLLRFQNHYYGLFAAVMGFLVPTLVAGLGWDDWW